MWLFLAGMIVLGGIMLVFAVIGTAKWAAPAGTGMHEAFQQPAAGSDPASFVFGLIGIGIMLYIAYTLIQSHFSRNSMR